MVDLDLDVGGDKDRYRARLNENLKKLAKYDLIEVKVAYGKNAEVIVKPWVLNNTECFEIPESFWSYGWAYRLSLKAQFCLFINFVNSGHNHEIWFKSKKLLQREYGISHSTFSDGMLELKKWDLIEIQYGNLESGFAGRPANRYRLKNLYSMNTFNAELEKMKAKYGSMTVDKAREFSKVLMDEYNLEHIEDIVLLIKEYGVDRVRYAFNKVSKYKIDNPMRSIRYVAGILKSEDMNIQGNAD